MYFNSVKLLFRGRSSIQAAYIQRKIVIKYIYICDCVPIMSVFGMKDNEYFVGKELGFILVCV